jgi:hypothetical protein
MELTMKTDRAMPIVAALLSMAVPGFSAAQPAQNPADTAPQTGRTASGPPQDFDFLIGRWQVHHRRLKERLANSHEWIEFAGTSVVWKVMGGYGTMDDNVLELPGGTYRAAGLKSFDPKSGQWSIWWLDSRTPLGPLDPPVRGRFRDGIGTFFSDEIFNGRPIRVRFTWSDITPSTCHWEQAFSTDGGATWETNWVMDFTRMQ